VLKQMLVRNRKNRSKAPARGKPAELPGQPMCGCR
jgi:hypothetical protein